MIGFAVDRFLSGYFVNTKIAALVSVLLHLSKNALIEKGSESEARSLLPELVFLRAPQLTQFSSHIHSHLGFGKIHLHAAETNAKPSAEEKTEPWSYRDRRDGHCKIG